MKDAIALPRIFEAGISIAIATTMDTGIVLADIKALHTIAQRPLALGFGCLNRLACDTFNQIPINAGPMPYAILFQVNSLRTGL